MRQLILVILLISTFAISQSDSLPGDLNNDTAIDILDIVLMVTIIMGEVDASEYQMWAGDINLDNDISILDVIQLINVIVSPIDCGDNFICPDNPYECCTNLHSESFINCAMCHTYNYNQTENPDHSTQVYPTNYCNLCHNPVLGWHNPNWSHIYVENSCINCHQANLAHVQNMGHSEYVCTHCHPSLEIADEPVCYDCHMDNYLATDDPDHQAMGLSENCAMCHGFDGWAGADPHSATDHSCSFCHNFNGVGNPLPDIDHLSAVKLGDDIYNCAICHTSTNQWTSVNFGSNRHDGSTYGIYFNIYSGDHNNQWGNSCTNNCHVFESFDTFSCWDNCHAGIHSNGNIEDEHCNNNGDCVDCNGWNGYWNVGYIEFEDGSWSNPDTFQQCYTCHPNGDDNGPCADH